VIPEKLTLHNFMSYQSPDSLDFSSFNIACLAGENGVGKSSLLEAISWALWGKSRAGADDDLVNQNANEMWVDFVFRIDKNLYKVLRKRKKGKRGHSELYLYSYHRKTSGYHSLSQDTIASTQNKIEELIRTPYRIFTNSAYLRQGKADEFFTKTAAERKEILSEILDLELYENLSKKAREKAKSAKTQSESVKIQIEELKLELSKEDEIRNQYHKIKNTIRQVSDKLLIQEKKLKNLQLKISQKDSFDQKKANLQNTLDEIVIKGKKLRIEKQQSDDEINEIQRLIKNEKKILIGFDNLKRLEKQDQELNDKQIKVLELNKKTAVLEAAKDKIEKQIGRITQISKCPTCLRSLPKNEAKIIISSLKKEIDQDVLLKLNKIHQLIKKINYNSLEHQRIKNQIEELQIFQDQRNLLDRNKAVLLEKIKLAEKYTAEIKILKTEYLVKNQELKNIDKEIKQLLPYQIQFEKQKSESENLQNQMSSEKENLGMIIQQQNQIANFKKKMVGKKDELKKTYTDAEIYLELAEHFSKKGLQARILENAIPEIENQANQILEKLTQGAMQISLVTQRLKKAQKPDQNLIETLDIQIKDSLGLRKYEMFSGGEAFRVNFALRIALSKFLAQKVGAKLQFLAIDEGFGTQDDRGKTQLVEAINSISRDFEKIIVITHIQELKDSFGTRIDVTKDENGSQIKMVY